MFKLTRYKTYYNIDIFDNEKEEIVSVGLLDDDNDDEPRLWIWQQEISTYVRNFFSNDDGSVEFTLATRLNHVADDDTDDDIFTAIIPFEYELEKDGYIKLASIEIDDDDFEEFSQAMEQQVDMLTKWYELTKINWLKQSMTVKNIMNSTMIDTNG